MPKRHWGTHKVELESEFPMKNDDLTIKIVDLTMKVVDLTLEGKSLYLNCHCRNFNQIWGVTQCTPGLQQVGAHVNIDIQLFAGNFDRRDSGYKILSF